MDGLIFIAILYLILSIVSIITVFYLLVKFNKMNKTIEDMQKTIQKGIFTPAKEAVSAEIKEETTSEKQLADFIQSLEPETEFNIEEFIEKEPMPSVIKKEEATIGIPQKLEKKSSEEKPVTKDADRTSEEQEERDEAQRTIPAFLNFLKGGNIWVAVGVVFLVLGLAFTYRYISMKYHIPAELKVSAGMLLGFALFGLGWKLRKTKTIFALIVQGGGIGAVYLSLFASVKIFNLLSAELVFILMIVLIALSVIISVVQNSQILAIYSSGIGFAAPLLLSTGSGNYIALFSFYILINLGVLAIATKKYWRFLNSISFITTVVIAYIWGAESYKSEYFFNCELFLIGFFLIFTAINILASLRQQNNKIENTFALTTSFVYMAMQLIIIDDLMYKYGEAIAAFTLGFFYVALSFILGKKLREKLTSLVTLYLSLGIIFLNFSLPLAIDSNMTYAIWAVEGTMLIFLGIKQANSAFRLIGLGLVYIATIFSFSGGAIYSPSDIRFDFFMYVSNNEYLAFLNSYWICKFLSSAALLISSFMYNSFSNKFTDEAFYYANRFISKGFYFKVLKSVAIVTLIVSLQAWTSTFRDELSILISGSDIRNVNSIFLTYSIIAVVFAFSGKRFDWKLPQYLAYLPIVFIGLITAASLITLTNYNYVFYFIHNGWIVWIFYAISQFFLIKYYTMKADAKLFPEKFVNKINKAWHGVNYFVLTYVLAMNAAYLYYQQENVILYLGINGIVIALVIWLTLNIGYLRKIPAVKKYPSAYLKWGTGLLALTIVYFLIHKSPLYNNNLISALNISDIAMVATVIYWTIYMNISKEFIFNKIFRRAINVTCGFVTFYWMHDLLARLICYFTDYSRYTFEWLFASPAYQLSIAVLWGITGFTLMLLGHKHLKRLYWSIGAVLLGMDAIKLLLIDLSKAGTLARIGSFMAVGIILIVIGYFVPLPPKEEKNELEKAHETN